MDTLIHHNGHFILIVFLIGAVCDLLALTEPGIELDSTNEWWAQTYSANNIQILQNDYSGGRFDIFGTGALLLSRKDTSRPFIKTSAFAHTGRWTSKWIDRSPGLNDVVVEATVNIYGQPQDMSTGWTKFPGNPVIAPTGHPHATEQSLLTPTKLEGNDPALVKGSGQYEGQWLLIFNVGPWASGGWAMAVADSLAPLKAGRNPFRLVKPFPLYTAKGRHAPNDWIQVDGRWFGPDESRNRRSHMWTTDDFSSWSNRSRIRGIKGHDPGIVYDGERYYLFLEDGDKLQYSTTKNPLDKWQRQGVALAVGDHTGDADLSFFNNRWHMFFDDGPHLNYSIGYATTTAGDFPQGWQLTNDVFGPHNPEQKQQWDDPTPEGNLFGTGDADIAIEGTTLYMVYERPVGMAWKELELLDGRQQQISVQLEIDTDLDGKSDKLIPSRFLSTGNSSVVFEDVEPGNIRLILTLSTENEDESPLLRRLAIRYQVQDDHYLE